MEKLKTPTAVYLKAEEAIAPIDQVVSLLGLVHGAYSLGNEKLDELERMQLLMNYDTIGEMLILAMSTLKQVLKDFKAIEIENSPDPEPTNESAN